MHIGLIGGIGPAATMAYYRGLCDQMRARGKPLELTIVQSEIATLARNNAAGDLDAQAAVYAPLIDRLKAAGAACAAITSIGGHMSFAPTLKRASLPMISAIAPLDSYFVGQGLTRVGLLGTVHVMGSRLFGQLAQTEAVVPDADMDAIGQTYIDIALSGACTAAQRDRMIAAGTALVRDQGAQAVVLAGTDLGLAFHGQDTGYRVIDALDVHVDVLAKLAADEIDLAEVAA